MIFATDSGPPAWGIPAFGRLSAPFVRNLKTILWPYLTGFFAGSVWIEGRSDLSGIEELRQRVMDAEQRFGLNDAQRAKYSERLIVLMNAVEGRIREQQDQID